MSSSNEQIDQKRLTNSDEKMHRWSMSRWPAVSLSSSVDEQYDDDESDEQKSVAVADDQQ